jgi:hypothetical protein
MSVTFSPFVSPLHTIVQMQAAIACDDYAACAIGSTRTVQTFNSAV